MREFILLALKAKTSPDFKLGGADRMDLVCRMVSNCFNISNDIRRDTVLHIVMTGPKDPPKCVSFYGETLRGMDPDEQCISEMIRRALKEGIGLKLNEERDVSPGVKVSKKALETLLKERIGKRQIIYLHKKGKDVREFKFEKEMTFILGDFIGMPRNTESLLERSGALKMSLGPTMLFASHCSIVIHNELDRRAQSF